MEKLNLKLIEQRRKELNISRAHMAEAIGKKDMSTYYKYEKGHYKFSANHVPILCAELQLSKDEIYFFEKNVSKTETKIG